MHFELNLHLRVKKVNRETACRNAMGDIYFRLVTLA